MGIALEELGSDRFFVVVFCLCDRVAVEVVSDGQEVGQELFGFREEFV